MQYYFSWLYWYVFLKFIYPSINTCIYFIVTPTVVKGIASRNLTIEQFTEGYVTRQCLKRLGVPQEIANMVIFLASDLCPFITGANFLVDGGYTTI
jgi:NAD(P)-dependent dehydrogenase (short-subunit alcohol dehydrogenase family)